MDTSDNKSSSHVDDDNIVLNKNPTVVNNKSTVLRYLECLITPTYYHCKNYSILICAKRGLESIFYCKNYPVLSNESSLVQNVSMVRSNQRSLMSASAITTPKLSINSEASFPILSQCSSIENNNTIELDTTIGETETTKANTLS